MGPKVSIIVPVYNCEKFLPACIDSIAGQSCADFECVLVNDGSSDGSPAVCDGISRRDPRFRVIHQKNAGVSAARNAGIEAARGEYIFFCDADDAAHPRLLELALAEQAQHPRALIGWKFSCDLSAWDKLELPDHPPASSFGRRDLLRLFGDRILFNSVSNKLFRRDILQDRQIRFDVSMRSSEDYDFFNRVWKAHFSACPNGEIRLLDLPLYYYNQDNAGSITHTTGAAHTRDFSGYCRQQLELYAQTKAIFGPFEQYPAQDVLSVVNATLNSIAFGLCNTPHPHRELAALWEVPEMREISQLHRRHRVHNAYLFFLRLRWAGGLRWWWNVISEKHSHIFYTVYHLGYRNILKP